MISDSSVSHLIDLALAEDLGTLGDLSTTRFIPKTALLRARLTAKEDGVLCGRPVVDAVFKRIASGARIRWKVREGGCFKKGAELAFIEGPRAILTAERTALNFLQQLSGIASLTRAFAEKTKGTRASVYDTRKTLPGWRSLAKYAVRIGGGKNHRMGLYDMVMLKDNHLAAQGSLSGAKARIAAFRKKFPSIPIEIEAGDSSEVSWALELGAELILLDNMALPALRREIARIRKSSPKTKIEISGGVRLADVAKLARLGPDRISVGRLTHSAPAIDISMKLV